jgi:hypothetical protein
MNKITLLILTWSISFTSLWAQTSTFNLYFNSGQKTVAAKQKLELEKLAFKYTRPTRITIYPLIFDKQRNVWAYSMFAEEQAQSIMHYAKQLGFKVIGAPSNFPSGYYGRSQSVVLQIIPKSRPVKRPKNALESLDNPLLPLFGVKPSQFYTIDPNKDTILYGKEGTVLYIKAQALLAKDSVKVELKEYYTMADYVKSALPSVSNGKLLETGGTIYLDARAKNNPNTRVPINKSKGIGIDFTKGKDDQEMEVFYQDNRSPNELNWIKQSKRKVIVTKKWSMTETKLGPEGEILSKRVFHSKEEWNKYRDSLGLARKKEKEKRETFAQNKREMEGKLKAFKLGLINCDKFYDQKTAPFAFRKTDTLNTTYYMVFTNIRGVISGTLNAAGNVSFGAVPIGVKAYVLAVSYINNQAYFDKVSVNTSNKNVQCILQPVSKGKIDQELALLK